MRWMVGGSMELSGLKSTGSTLVLLRARSCGNKDHPTGWNKQRRFIQSFGGNDGEAEISVLWPPYVKSWLIGKDSDAGRDWGQEEKGTTEDEMAGWLHRLNGPEFEWTPGVGDGQGGLACWDSWGRKESDTTERLNWTELIAGESATITCIWLRPKAVRGGEKFYCGIKLMVTNGKSLREQYIRSLWLIDTHYCVHRETRQGWYWRNSWTLY